MYAFFNSLNELTFISENIVQGSKGANTLYASFENRTWATHPIASITFRRDDGSISPEVFMTQQSFTYDGTTYSNGFVFNFYDEWFTAIAGKLEATIRLYATTGQITAMGLITTEVQEGTEPAYVELNTSQYQDLVALIAEAYTDVEKLHFDETYDPQNLISGDLYYDNTTNVRTLTYIHTHENGETQSIPVGQVLYGIGKNTSGGTLIKGSPVAWSGVQGNHPTFTGAGAAAASPELNAMVGIADTSTDNNEYGPVVVFGIVKEVDIGQIMESQDQLSSLTFGTKLYLSATTPGTFTINEPARPNASVWAGTILSLNTNQYNNADLFVHIQRPRTASGGVDIQLSDNQPSGQIEGDIWFDRE